MGVPKLAADNIWELPVGEKRTATLRLSFTLPSSGSVSIKSVYREDNPGTIILPLAQILALPTATGTFTSKLLVAGPNTVDYVLVIDAPVTTGPKRYYFVLESTDFPELSTGIYTNVRVTALATVSKIGRASCRERV